MATARGSVAPSFSIILPFFLLRHLPNHSFYPTLTLFYTTGCLMNHVTVPHTQSLSRTLTSILPSTPLQFSLHPHLGFSPPPPNAFLPWSLIHWPLCFAQSTRQIIILSAVTKEMHTPSITMYKFSVRRFGQVLIKKPFLSFS